MDNPDNFFDRMQNFIVTGDLSVYEFIASETTDNDRGSLLAIQNIVRNHVPGYVYLEIGSYLGGSLFPHLADVRCKLVYSVDRRVESMLDERGRSFSYPGSITAQMIAELQKHLPLAAMMKLHTYDADIAELTAEDIGLACDLIFIDAEHTNKAAFADFCNARRFATENSIIAFHDAQYISDALANIEQMLSGQNVKNRTFILSDCIFVMLFGDFADVAGNVLSRLSFDKEKFFREAKTDLWKIVAENNKQPDS